MPNTLAANKQTTQTPVKKPLSRSLLLWFLILSLVPLIIAALFSYQQASSSLSDAAVERLQKSAALNASYIQNWFKYRFLELESKAESLENVRLLSSLTTGFKQSNLSLDKYVKSYQWALLVDGSQGNLLKMSQRYRYVYDLFLIDIQGNLLFSVAGESDLGTNLFNGVYANTRFARSVKATLETGQSQFSDLERYEPSNGIIAGFLSTLILDEYGGKLGVFAIQIKVDSVFVNLSTKVDEFYSYYLVGEDGRLRTAQHLDQAEVLTRVIKTEQFKLWKSHLLQSQQREKGAQGRHKDAGKFNALAFKYSGPNAETVIGTHFGLDIKGVQWALIAEVNEADALASVTKLGQIIFMLLFATVVIVTLLSIYQAKRITQPIIKLAIASKKAAAGDIDLNIEIDSEDEIGELAYSFSEMLRVRQLHDHELQKSAQQTLDALDHLAEQKFALDQHAIVAVTDVKGTIIFVNDKFSEISGYSEAELIGQNHRMLNSGYHPTDFFREMYRTIASGEVWHDEVCNKAKDGQLYWVDTTIVPFKNKHGKPKSYIAIRADITVKKQAAIAMQEAKELAEETTRLKSDFLANMSHEIRTPMNGIIGATGLLLETQLNGKQQNLAETTMYSANALLVLINDILDFSKIEAGKLELENIDFDLQLLAEEVAEILALKCREKNIEMLLRYVSDTGRYFKGDPGRIRQVLLNLLSNAIKFTQTGSVLLTVSLDDAETEAAKKLATVDTRVLRLSIQDTGIGIAADKLDAVFKQFEQADSSTTRHFGGTGLGLAICKQLAHLMGGDVGVESQVGQGSTFWFTIQLEQSNEQQRDLKLDDFKSLVGLRCMLVDDNAIARMIYSEQLSAYGIKVTAIPSAVTAIQQLLDAANSDSAFDLVISDLQMPDMDGATFAKQIKTEPEISDLPLILLTSSPQKGDNKKMHALGFSGYLTKPIHSMEIPKMLSAIWNAQQNNKNIGMVTRYTLQEASVKPVEKLKLEQVKILLVEDNAVNQMVATAILQSYGGIITPALNGLEALEQFKANRYDLIFMDCQMPEMDGFEATRQIRIIEQKREQSKTPIVAFTANAMAGDKDKCLAAGMDDFITKPVKKEDIERILLSCLASKVIADTSSSHSADDGENRQGGQPAVGES